MELEPWLKEKAQSNQRAGGQTKGSSKLTEAERIDVRSQIATAAGVSVGNVTKVKQLTTTAHSDIIKALRAKKLSPRLLPTNRSLPFPRIYPFI